jgi:hypothetical protein
VKEEVALAKVVERHLPPFASLGNQHGTAQNKNFHLYVRNKQTQMQIKNSV